MIRQVLLYTALMTFFLQHLTAQEVISGLQYNYEIQKNRDLRLNKGTSNNDTLSLPFFDDFSGHSPFPDNNKWLDNFVFINNTYSDQQITKGIATFDAIDNSGNLYETSTITVFKADQLTSKPLNLEYPASSNIFFSFLYEKGGLSDVPESGDSLILQFLAPEEKTWYSVWRSPADNFKGFKNVIIPVVNELFLKNGFQFRFINYASLSNNQTDHSMVGNCDIWNIDYLLLNINRNEGDTIFTDVAFTLPVRSVLLNHEAMPWKHFKKVFYHEMGSSDISIYYRNNDTIVRNVTRDFQIWDVYNNSEAHSFTSGASNIDPLSNVSYNADLVYTFNNDDPDSALFRITCILKTDEFDPKENDTLVYYQVFNNYFAYDDGSSEGGYGINGLGSRNAMMAYRFTSFMQDTIRAIGICFNDSYLDANKRAFDLMVWDDNNGTPGNVIYTREEVMVSQGDRINGFRYYVLPDGVMVDGIFYVGWRQRSETFLNAGFDINTPNLGRQYYWLNGEWHESQVNGSVMIRPLAGERLKVTSTGDEIISNKGGITIWPNPARDYITVELKDQPYSNQVHVIIVDLSGHELINIPLINNKIDISGLHRGLYIVITSINGRNVGYNRLIKSR